MNDAQGLLQELWSKGVELRVVQGALYAKPSELVNDYDRQKLRAHKPEVMSLLAGQTTALAPEALAHIQRLASHIGTVVDYGGKSGLLIGIFRDRAVVDTGKVILSLDHKNVAEMSSSSP